MSGGNASTSEVFAFLPGITLAPQLPQEICRVGCTTFSTGTYCKHYITDFLIISTHYFPDNHDIISMKLYQLMVEHTPEEENLDWTKIEPSVSLLKSPKGKLKLQEA